MGPVRLTPCADLAAASAVIYAMKTRVGGVYLRMQKRNGALPLPEGPAAPQGNTERKPLPDFTSIERSDLVPPRVSVFAGDLSCFEKTESTAFMRERNGALR